MARSRSWRWPRVGLEKRSRKPMTVPVWPRNAHATALPRESGGRAPLQRTTHCTSSWSEWAVG
eukprot:2718681-Alexandrium_andersonii.AAC.1